MNTYVQRLVSMLLIIFVVLLGLDYLQIVQLSVLIRSCLYVLTLIFLIISSTAVVCSDAAVIHKIINYTILFLTAIGLIFSAVNGIINFTLYVVVLFAFGYSCYEIVVRA